MSRKVIGTVGESTSQKTSNKKVIGSVVESSNIDVRDLVRNKKNQQQEAIVQASKPVLDRLNPATPKVASIKPEPPSKISQFKTRFENELANREVEKATANIPSKINSGQPFTNEEISYIKQYGLESFIPAEKEGEILYPTNKSKAKYSTDEVAKYARVGFLPASATEQDKELFNSESVYNFYRRLKMANSKNEVINAINTAGHLTAEEKNKMTSDINDTNWKDYVFSNNKKKGVFKYAGLVDNKSSDNLQEKSKLYVQSGINNFITGIGNTAELAVRGDSYTSDEMSEYQYASSFLANYFKNNDMQAEKVFQDTVTNLAQNVLPLALQAIPVVGQIAYMGSFAASAFGSSFDEAWKLSGIESMDKSSTAYIKKFSDITGYALASATAETMLEKLSNALGSKIAGGESLDIIADNIKNNGLKLIAKMGIAGGGEFIEESTQTVLSPILQNIFLNTKNDTIFTDFKGQLSEAAYSGFIGFLSGAAMGSVNAVLEIKQDKKLAELGKNYKENSLKTGINVKNIAQYFKEVSNFDSSLYELANDVANGDSSDLSVGKMMQEAMRVHIDANAKINTAVGDTIKSSGALETTITEYEKLNQDGLIFPDRVVNLYNTIKSNIESNIEPSSETVGEFALAIDEYSPKALILKDMVEKVELTDRNSNYIPDENSLKPVTFTESVEQVKKSATNPKTSDGVEESKNKAIGFTEPTDKEIYREPTTEEMSEAVFGKRKNAKQRHILDVANKLDKDLKVIYAPRSSNILNGKNGKYDHDTKTMYLAEDLTTVEAYAEVFKHEFVHRLELRKAYDSFKKYLFNKSEAFELYAKSRLYILDGEKTVERTREEAISALIDMYITNFKGDNKIPQKIRDNFTREKAEREAVADFVARVLFKGNTSDLRMALNDSQLREVVGMETDLSLFEQMAKDDRSLLKKIIDVIKDFIRNIKGVPQFKSLEQDLKYIEERITRVYNSADNKKTSTDSGEVYKNTNTNVSAKTVQSLSEEGIEYDVDSESLYSADSWESSEYVKDRKSTAKKIAEAIGISERKALQYIKDIDSIANKILSNYARLGYVPSPDRSAFVSNAEYGGSIDMSTLCAKRRWLTGTFSAIQRALKNTALTANEILEIRNMLKEKGMEVSCGLCYVEGSRAQMGRFAKEFIERYKKRNPDWVPNMTDVNTPEGVEQMRMEHPEAYEAYESFWNNKGVLNEGERVLFASQQKPKLYQLRTDYKHEILDKFNNEDNVDEKNKKGGLRIQSFSDFEIVHLIDMMQVIIDMSRVGLNGQAYTKVPEFALALGNTGLKINLSLIAKDVDAEGNLVFDDIEGMPFETAMNIRNMYSKNVGTVLVVFNDAQLMAALKDSRIDFVLPFHRSQWKKAMYDQLGLPTNTKDYTYVQNERYIKPVYYTTRKGTIGKRKATNYMPNEYWDFNISGKENAKKYLRMCAEENKRPKFYKFLDDNGDGSYSLKKDGSTDGYWKLLIDFKMYDNEGKGSKQTAVKPDFNMEECHKMLDEYQGEHSTFPVDQDVVDRFVSNYIKKHGEQGFKDVAKSETKSPTTKYDVSFSSDDLKFYSGSKGSENLHNTPENLKPETEREWSTFNRQFANKTNDLKIREKSNIIIYTADYVYLVTADGYMSGKIVDKLLIDGNEEIINDTIKEFKNGNFKPTERINNVIQSIRNERGRSRLGNALSSGNITTEVDDFLDREEYSSDTGRSASKSNVDKIKNEESYSSDDIPNQTKDLIDRYTNGEISQSEFLNKANELWIEANEKFGSLPQGENAKNSIQVPEAVTNDKPTERFIRTIIETDTLKENALKNMGEKVLLGDFSYEVISDDSAIKKADNAIKNGTAESAWENTVEHSAKIGKNQIAIGEKLLTKAIKENDVFAIMKLSSELSDVLTRAGQIVQAARLLKKMSGPGRLVALQRTVKTLNNDLQKKYGIDRTPIRISEETAQRIVNGKTPNGLEYAYQEALREIADQVPATWLDKWNAWRYYAMLANPKTHIKNLSGNGIFLPAVMIKSAIASTMELAIDESQRTKTLVVKKEYLDYAKKDSKRDDVKTLLKGNKYSDKSEIREKQQIFKSEALEFLTQFNSNALEFEDMIFKNVHYISALAGFLQARKVNLNNVSEQVLSEARTYAIKEAKKATFNDESALANMLQNATNHSLIVDVALGSVLPFKRTPINVIKRGIEYSPIGLTKSLTKGLYDVKKGKITPAEFIDGIAAGTTGTFIIVVGLFLASLGCVTGSKDDDELSTFEKWLGKQEYSVEILGKSYTIDWSAPASIPFFIGVELFNTMKDDDEFQLSKLGNVAWNTLEPIINLSMLSGIQGVIESARYADENQILSAIVGDAITSYVMQGIPSTFGALSRTVDSKERMWYTDKNSKMFDSFSQSVINNVKSKIPGLSYTQAPKIDPWGRTVTRGGVGERILENFISPGYYSEIEYSDIDKELKRLFISTEENVLPKTASKSFAVNKETKYLTADEYVTYAKAKGEYSFDYVYEFINSNKYEKLSDEEKVIVITNLYKFADAKAKTTVSDYDLLAKGSNYKTVTLWERNGKSVIDYYIFKAITK